MPKRKRREAPSGSLPEKLSAPAGAPPAIVKTNIPTNKRKITIGELEAILTKEEDVEIEILPNGEIVALGEGAKQDLGTRKPLTMRENLGGEYSDFYKEAV